MTDEVGPNDPHRGRSSAGGFKMPFSKPIVVRDVDDVYDAAWGGMRKPKPRDDRETDAPQDLAGGGYTAAQTNDQRGRLWLIFLGLPIVLLAIIGVLGWLTGVATSVGPRPTEQVCSTAGVEVSFRRTDLGRASRVRVEVEFTADDGTTSFRSNTAFVGGSRAEEVTVYVPAPGTAPVQRCDIRSVIASE